MRLPFTPVQTAVGAGALAALALLVLLVVMIRSFRARAAKQTLTEAALPAFAAAPPTPAAAPPAAFIGAESSRSSRSAHASRAHATSTVSDVVDRSPTEPIPVSTNGQVRSDQPEQSGEAREATTNSNGASPKAELETAAVLASQPTPTNATQPETTQSEASEPENAATQRKADHPIDGPSRPGATQEETALAAETASDKGDLAAEPDQRTGRPAGTVTPRADTTRPLDAKDKLLRVLLADPERALRAVNDLEACQNQLDQLNQAIEQQRRLLADVARHLRGAGLTPAQIAQLTGCDEGELVALLADHPLAPLPAIPEASAN